eukprot:TRINITY_DN18290_c0_g1_i2.p1 TRINITY_DN18290_c0_g1~~TRINITY_DN18290_c0_g1_i2.p1  ORF type:complete len:137 (-),score=24.36 TRINITY_DN18290_c0_g1_i2:238-648(-)
MCIRDRPAMKHYGQSKLAQVLWTQELTARLSADSSIVANSYHPGMAHTNVFKTLPFGKWMLDFIENQMSKLMWTPEQGALTGLYLGVEAGKPEHLSRGKYYHPMVHLMEPSPHARNQTLQQALWEFSDELVAKFTQ